MREDVAVGLGYRVAFCAVKGRILKKNKNLVNFFKKIVSF